MVKIGILSQTHLLCQRYDHFANEYSYCFISGYFNSNANLLFIIPLKISQSERDKINDNSHNIAN